jgi:PEP-CTERM motif
MLPSMRVTYGGGTAGLSLTPYAIEVSVERSVAAVPEPSTWAMLLFGFAGIECVSYRRLKDCRTPWIENWGIRVARFPGEQCGHDGSGKNRRNAPADAEKCGELGGVIRHCSKAVACAAPKSR